MLSRDRFVCAWSDTAAVCPSSVTAPSNSSTAGRRTRSAFGVDLVVGILNAENIRASEPDFRSSLVLAWQPEAPDALVFADERRTDHPERRTLRRLSLHARDGEVLLVDPRFSDE